MRISACLLLISLGVSVLAYPSATRADWAADPGNEREVKAAQVIARMQEDVPRTKAYFADAYGMAVWPSIVRVGVGFGGAYGKGIVIEGDRSTGTVSYKQFTSGMQAGAKSFSMIIFFRDKAALDAFKEGKVQFMGQAGIDLATVGAHGTPGYNDGVAVVTMTRLGLMGEFTVSGVKFSYRPGAEGDGAVSGKQGAAEEKSK